MKAIRHKTNKGPSTIFKAEENLFFDLPKCFVVAIILPVGKSFDTEWLVRVAGGLWTVSTAGIITAGVPFKEWAMWVVLADRNLEKPGDIHLEENILEEKNHARYLYADFENFSNMAGEFCVTITHDAMQGKLNRWLVAHIERHFRSFAQSFPRISCKILFKDFLVTRCNKEKWYWTKYRW